MILFVVVFVVVAILKTNLGNLIPQSDISELIEQFEFSDVEMFILNK